MAIIDEELDALLKEREKNKTEQAEAITETPVEIEEVKEAVPTVTTLPQTSVAVNDMATTIQKAPSSFEDYLETANIALLHEGVKDERYVKSLTEEVKETLSKHTQVKKEKETLEQKKVLSAQEQVDEERVKTGHRVQQDRWSNKEKRRQFHYNGVSPIMKFVGIEEPLNLFLLYLLTFVLLPFFLIGKLLKGTVGVLVAGASDQDRPKAVKGFLWTMLGVIVVAVVALAVYLFLKWQGIIMKT